MTRYLFVIYLTALFVLAGCGRVNRITPKPPPEDPSAVAARDAYGREVGRAFRQAAEEYRDGLPETQINANMEKNVRDLPEAAWTPLMKKINKARSREEKAALLEAWSDALGGDK